jgi:hypothetical protein
VFAAWSLLPDCQRLSLDLKCRNADREEKIEHRILKLSIANIYRRNDFPSDY